MESKLDVNTYSEDSSTGDSPLVHDDDCGKSFFESINDQTRIVNGEDVPVKLTSNNVYVHPYPWMVRISRSKTTESIFCGGTLISRRHVLTAAHCMIKFERKPSCQTKTYCKRDEVRLIRKSKKWVTLGDYNMKTNKMNEGEVQMEISDFVTHPKTHQLNPSEDPFLYDFAILTLQECVNLDVNIQPACLPKNNQDTYENKKVSVIGWGLDRYDVGKNKNILQYINITVLSGYDCRSPILRRELPDAYYNPLYIMCAGDPLTGDKDGCQNDSGGK